MRRFFAFLNSFTHANSAGQLIFYTFANNMRYVLLAIFLFYSVFADGQSYHGSIERGSDLKMLTYNVGFGGITAGIGAVINKPKETPMHKAFFKGFYQGCLGGALQYGGKKMTYQIVEKYNYWCGLPAKLVHTAGTTIVENAAYNRPFGRYWNLDLGPLRFDFAFNTEDEPFRVRFSAMIIYDIIAAGVQPSSSYIDWGKSLKLGTLTFYTNEPISRNENHDIIGTAYCRSFIYNTRSKDIHQTVVHELIHLFQRREHLVFNAWLNPLASKASPKIKNVFHNYIYIEPPYFSLFYLMQGYHERENYYRNFYEFEAEWFATKGYF